MNEVVIPAKIHGRTIELTEAPINLGFSENEELLVILRKKVESVVEKTAGTEIDEHLIDESIELTELGE
jgi:hypothetical protein